MKKIIEKNENVVILYDESSRTALLMDNNSFIVASNYDNQTRRWSSGEYYGKKTHRALDRALREYNRIK